MKKRMTFLALLFCVQGFCASPCDNLSEMGKQFSTLLTPENQDLFCSQFTEKQRDDAIRMTGQLDTNGNPMNPDQAVQQVAQDNSIILPLQPQEPANAPMVQPPHVQAP